ncbi:MAG: hypothetical protein CML43_17025 [Rhodobacteraceae bacterium]|nr:hypothetical protein [Paracoccaceae bacterium]
MTITGAIVLWAVIWFMTLYVSLPLGMRSQGDMGEVVPGTPASAPANLRLKRKLWITTAVTAPLWLAVVLFIAYGGYTLDELDFVSDIKPTWDAAPAAQ